MGRYRNLIKRLPSGRYEVFILVRGRDGERSRVRRRFGSLAEAKEFRDRVKYGGLPKASMRISLYQLCDDYYRHLVSQGRSEGTLHYYRTRIKMLKQFLGNLYVDAINNQEIDRFIERRRRTEVGRQKTGGASILRDLKALVAFIRFANCPVLFQLKYVSIPFERRPKRQHSVDELKRLLAAMGEGSLERTVAEVALHTGMRISEVYAIRIRDVDMNRRVILVPLKKVSRFGHKVQPFMISDSLHHHLILYALTHNQNLPDDTLFFRIDNRPLRTPSLRKRILRACEMAGIHPPILGFGHLRHHYVSLLNQQGVPLSMVAKAIGHTSPTITAAHYTLPLPEEVLRSLAAAIDKVMDGSETIGMKALSSGP